MASTRIAIGLVATVASTLVAFAGCSTGSTPTGDGGASSGSSGSSGGSSGTFGSSGGGVNSIDGGTSGRPSDSGADNPG